MTEISDHDIYQRHTCVFGYLNKLLSEFDGNIRSCYIVYDILKCLVNATSTKTKYVRINSLKY